MLVASRTLDQFATQALKPIPKCPHAGIAMQAVQSWKRALSLSPTHDEALLINKTVRNIMIQSTVTRSRYALFALNLLLRRSCYSVVCLCLVVVWFGEYLNVCDVCYMQIVPLILPWLNRMTQVQLQNDSRLHIQTFVVCVSKGRYICVLYLCA